jgi:hypothetical protein
MLRSFVDRDDIFEGEGDVHKPVVHGRISRWLKKGIDKHKRAWTESTYRALGLHQVCARLFPCPQTQSTTSVPSHLPSRARPPAAALYLHGILPTGVQGRTRGRGTPGSDAAPRRGFLSRR